MTHFLRVGIFCEKYPDQPSDQLESVLRVLATGRLMLPLKEQVNSAGRQIHREDDGH